MLNEEQQVPLHSLETIAEEQLALARDTNEVVHSIRRMMRISFWAKVVLWALIIILPVVFIGPILKTIQSFVPTIQVGSQSVPVFSVPSTDEIQKAFQRYAVEKDSESPAPQPAPAVVPTEELGTTTASTMSP